MNSSTPINAPFTNTRPVGGISSNFQALKANFLLSSAVALTGLAAPMGISFFLLGILPVTPVQAFAAGAALCSTSLGTTFTVLYTSGLTESRLGVVLTSAAMMDDVVGLIMVKVISTLGAGSEFNEVTVIRPIFVSIAFGVLIPLICRFIAKPILQGANNYLARPQCAKYKPIFHSSNAAFVLQTSVLLAMVAGANYAGTSDLLAAYLAGASVTWLGEYATDPTPERAATSQSPNPGPRISESNGNRTSGSSAHDEHFHCSGKEIFERYYLPAVNAILRPLFFASIGFAIPISRMFSGPVLWRGIVFTILMIFAKLICGLWLVRLGPLPRAKDISNLLSSLTSSNSAINEPSQRPSNAPGEKTEEATASTDTPTCPEPAVMRQNSGGIQHRSRAPAPNSENTSNSTSPSTPSASNTANTANTSRPRTGLLKPKSLYPGAILGSAMVSRGEIGFLISSVAEANGVFGGQGGNDDEFIIVTWAILLCTLVGPITVGILVRRVKRLQEMERRGARGRMDPLGVWGVNTSGTPS